MRVLIFSFPLHTLTLPHPSPLLHPFHPISTFIIFLYLPSLFSSFSPPFTLFFPFHHHSHFSPLPSFLSHVLFTHFSLFYHPFFFPSFSSSPFSHFSSFYLIYSSLFLSFILPLSFPSSYPKFSSLHSILRVLFHAARTSNSLLHNRILPYPSITLPAFGSHILLLRSFPLPHPTRYPLASWSVAPPSHRLPPSGPPVGLDGPCAKPTASPTLHQLARRTSSPQRPTTPTTTSTTHASPQPTAPAAITLVLRVRGRRARSRG